MDGIEILKSLVEKKGYIEASRETGISSGYIFQLINNPDVMKPGKHVREILDRLEKEFDFNGKDSNKEPDS